MSKRLLTYIFILAVGHVFSTELYADQLWLDGKNTEGSNVFVVDMGEGDWRKGWYGNLDLTALDLKRSDKTTPSGSALVIEFSSGTLRLLECDRTCIAKRESAWEVGAQLDDLGVTLRITNQKAPCGEHGSCSVFLPSWSLQNLQKSGMLRYFPRQLAMVARAGELAFFDAAQSYSYMGSVRVPATGDLHHVHYRDQGLLELSWSNSRYQIDLRQDLQTMDMADGSQWRSAGTEEFAVDTDADRAELRPYRPSVKPADCVFGGGERLGHAVLFNANGQLKACVDDRLFAVPFTHLGKGWTELRRGPTGHVVAYHATKCQVLLFEQTTPARWKLRAKREVCGVEKAFVVTYEDSFGLSLVTEKEIHHEKFAFDQ